VKLRSAALAAGLVVVADVVVVVIVVVALPQLFFADTPHAPFAVAPQVGDAMSHCSAVPPPPEHEVVRGDQAKKSWFNEQLAETDPPPYVEHPTGAALT
jgi:hypothetical protein